MLSDLVYSDCWRLQKKQKGELLKIHTSMLRLMERSKTYSFHQPQHRSKERPVQPLKTSRDTSPSSSSAVPSSKVCCISKINLKKDYKVDEIDCLVQCFYSLLSYLMGVICCIKL